MASPSPAPRQNTKIRNPESAREISGNVQPSIPGLQWWPSVILIEYMSLLFYCVLRTVLFCAESVSGPMETEDFVYGAISKTD